MSKRKAGQRALNSFVKVSRSKPPQIVFVIRRHFVHGSILNYPCNNEVVGNDEKRMHVRVDPIENTSSPRAMVAHLRVQEIQPLD